MSQNQSYFWKTTRRNVYLKRSAKLHMFLALLAVLTFSTICIAEARPESNDDTGVIMGVPTKIYVNDKQYDKDVDYDIANKIPHHDAVVPATKETAAKSQSGFIDAFSASISVILFTELGDKTFFIAAIMAMRHPRLIIFCGAISALTLMTILSVVFGMAATIIPKIYTYYISTALFAIFGLKMIYEGYFMKATDAQEELEEVQTSLRKREDELRLKRNKRGDDADAKRKNSNSDKEDGDAGVTERGAGAGTVVTTTGMTPTLKNPEMTHRQRKQPNNNNYNNNNNGGCEQVNKNNDDNDDSDVCNESDVFLDGVGENLKMSTFHSSPALSASVLSNQTDQTNCDEFTNSPNKINHNNNNNNSYKASNNVDQTNKQHNKLTDSSAVMVHSTSASAAFMGNGGKNVGKLTGSSSNSINSLSSLNSSTAVKAAGGGQPNGELKQLGGSKKRLERDVSATLVQDPESGLIRKNSKKSATYFTTRVLMQAFTMTFLAEWGDRSQLTTIILAASKDVYGVIAGGIIGHSICTGLAVIGGRMIATKISVRTVTILGGIVFLGFALYALLVRPDDI